MAIYTAQEKIEQARRQNEYRARLKAKGGRKVSITLSPEMVEATKLLGSKLLPDFDVDDVVRAFIMVTTNRALKIFQEKQKLEEIGANEKVIDGYVENELLRGEPLTCKQYLLSLKEVN